MRVEQKRSSRMAWIMGGMGVLLLVLILFAQVDTCYACTSQTPPPTCTTNMSAMTMRQGDNPKPWWSFASNVIDPRDEKIIRIYLGLNMNGGTTDVPYSYEIVANGDWMPQMTFPITGTGVLSPRVRNQTVMIELPYTENDVGVLTLTANVDSTCDFTPAPATTQVQLNPAGPTVWPITSRACPLAGDKQVFRFGIRNPGDTEQNYIMSARALTQFGGEHTPILNDNQADPGSAQLPMLTLKPNESRQVNVTCETFGFCLTGSESKVELNVQPVPGGAESFPDAFATSNITLRDPDTTCVAPEDWWSILSPLLLGLMLGIPLLLAAGGGGALWYKNRQPPPQILPEYTSPEPRKPKPPRNTGENTRVKPQDSTSSDKGDSTKID